MAQVYKDLTSQVDGVNQIFNIVGEQEKDTLSIFTVRYNSTVVPQPCVTELTSTSFELNFAPLVGDVLEVTYLDTLSNVTIIANNITNHILPISGQVISDVFVDGNVLETDGREATINVLNELNGTLGDLFNIQVSSNNETFVYGTVEKC
jgi:hypothetical protein